MDETQLVPSSRGAPWRRGDLVVARVAMTMRQKPARPNFLLSKVFVKTLPADRASISVGAGRPDRGPRGPGTGPGGPERVGGGDAAHCLDDREAGADGRHAASIGM
jgi:hypothetical protein